MVINTLECDIIRLLLSIVLVTSTGFCDGFKRNVPNSLVFPFLITSILLYFIRSSMGACALADHFCEILFLLILLVLYFLGTIGGGDLKALISLSLLTHPYHFIITLLLTTIIAVILSTKIPASEIPLMSITAIVHIVLILCHSLAYAPFLLSISESNCVY